MNVPPLFEVVSKPQIRFKGKAQADRESAAYFEYVSIYRRPETQPLGLRWGFETTSNQIDQPERSETLPGPWQPICLLNSEYPRARN
jgi:hypothetical protein